MATLLCGDLHLLSLALALLWLTVASSREHTKGRAKDRRLTNYSTHQQNCRRRFCVRIASAFVAHGTFFVVFSYLGVFLPPHLSSTITKENSRPRSFFLRLGERQTRPLFCLYFHNTPKRKRPCLVVQLLTAHVVC